MLSYKTYKSAFNRDVGSMLLLVICISIVVWSYIRYTQPIPLPPPISASQPAPSDSPQERIDKIKIELFNHYEYGSGGKIQPRYTEKEMDKGFANGRYLDNLFAVHLDGYAQKTRDEVIQRYIVDDDLSIHPWFDDLRALDTEKPGDDLQFTIPGTRQTLRVPSSYAVELNKEELRFNSSPLTQLAYICTDRDSPYCIEMRKVWGTRVTALASQYTSVTTRTVDWSGEIYAWISDHVSWQGSTEREWVARGQQKTNHQTIIANRTYYKLGLGCCGDITYSYITKGTSPMGTPLLIIFTVEGNQRFIDNSAERIAPNLEKILGTLQTR